MTCLVEIMGLNLFEKCRKVGIWIFHLIYFGSNQQFIVRLLRLSRYLPKFSIRNSNNDTIKVLYQSSNFLVVDKPHDVLINSNCDEKITVEHMLCQQFPNLANQSLVHSFHFIHRLDFSTSGVLCLACNKKAASLASEAFSSRKTKKYYIALVRGLVSMELLDIELAIGIDTRPAHFPQRMCTNKDKEFCQNPKPAVTRLLVLEKGMYNAFPATKIMLKAVTGKRHQLRVHCASIGHTIVGDYTYSNRKDCQPPRMFLHAYRLQLTTKLESIDVVSNDILCLQDNFSDSSWYSTTKVNSIGEESFKKIDSNRADATVK